MTPSIAELDAMPEADAAELLAECCGARRWVAAMAARRPFESRDAVNEAADEIWESLGASDWREAFASHPRIGERPGGSHGDRGSSWAAAEQSGMGRAEKGVCDALAAENIEYERRFGHIYIVCATGMSAEEMLALARRRLLNDPAAELRIAAEEQRKITRLRLDKLLGQGESS